MRKCQEAEAEADRSSILENQKQKLLMKNRCKTTFKDVAGLEGAKEEIQEIVEFENPEKYTNLGGKIPGFTCRSWNREDSISKSGCWRSASAIFLYQVLILLKCL
jgi:hypothetical protein